MKKLVKFIRDRKGNTELAAVGISIMILVILGSMAALIGNELEGASGLTYNYDAGATNSHWENVSYETGELGEDGFNILGVGIILAVILAAVGFIIFPYLKAGA